jgi:cytidylate kinase
MAVITISRQYGSGGDEIAARVREMLGYRLFDKRMMAQVASEMGLSEREIVDFSEEDYKVRGFLERLFGRRSSRVVAEVGTWTRDTAGVSSVAVEQLDEEWCITMVKSTIRGAYKHENIVIVGRGGQAVLQDMPDVLHVRVESPASVRAQRIQEQESVTPRTAEEMVSERDKGAAAYLKRFHDVEWDDPTLYHLVINTGKWDTEAAAHLIVNAVSYLPPSEAEG